MNEAEVLIDLLEDNRRRFHRLLDMVHDDCLMWRPDADANSIALTAWHMARIFDVFLTRQANGRLPEEENWFRNGWMQETGYDPRGVGQNGWGMMTGYTQEEVAAMPQFTRGQIIGYLNEVYNTVREYLADTLPDELQTGCAGFEGKYTKYQCIQMALLDNVRHLGEIFAIHARWKRRRT